MKLLRRSLFVLLLVPGLPAPVAAQPRDAIEGLSNLPIPRFVSLSAGIANMRSGPGDRYPVIWQYRRAGLPLKVVKEYGIWRQLEDPDGTTGWMNKNLISGTRTGYVLSGTQALHNRPDLGSPVAWRVEEGVVGLISKCRNGWCRFTVDGHTGYIRTAGLWGLLPGEAID